MQWLLIWPKFEIEIGRKLTLVLIIYQLVYNQHQGQLSLPSLRSKSVEYRPV